MRQLFFILLVLMIACKSPVPEEQRSAKNFHFSPSKLVQINGSSQAENTITGKSFLKCNSESAINLRWKKVEENYPAGWNVYYCDNVACYYVFPDSSDLAPVSIKDEANANRMKLYVESNQIKGKGKVKIAVYEINNSKNSDTITYQIDIK